MNDREKAALAWAVTTLEAGQGSSGRAHLDALRRMLDRGSPDVVGDVEDFHVKFGLAYRGPPRQLSRALSDFRTKFMLEELEEYDRPQEPAGKLDALVDLVYVALGTAYLHGFNFREAWRRVHAANMRKVRGPSMRSQEYDVVKPPGWVHPDLSDLAS